MAELEVDVFTDLPADLGPGSVVRFFPEYAVEHPLWLADGFPRLDDLRLPDELVRRLRRWSGYWNDTFHWDDGWPDGSPAPWWDAEEDALPRAVAHALGHDFVVHADARFLRSTTTAASPSAAAALHAIRQANDAEAVRVAAEIARGATFTAWAGDVAYASDESTGTPAATP